MKAALLATLLLLFASALPGQQTPKTPEDQPYTATTPAPQAGSAAQAPQLGHPLDPADVDILTGRNQPAAPRNQYATPYYSVSPYGTGGYGMGSGMRNGRFSLLNPRRPFGFLGTGSGLVFFGRGFVNPAP